MGHNHGDDDLNLLMPMHFRTLSKLDMLEGDTLRLDEYLGAKGHSQAFERSQGKSSAREVLLGRQGALLSDAVMMQGASPRRPARNKHPDMTPPKKAGLEHSHGREPEQENVPPAALVFMTRKIGQSQKRKGSDRVAKKRTFGLDLKQLSVQQDGYDSEAEWEARDQELARQRAERSAQRRQEKERQGARRQSMGPHGQDMELDSDDNEQFEDFDLGAGDIGGWGQEEEDDFEQMGGATQGTAWKTNPLFDGNQMDQQPAREPDHIPTPPPEAAPPTPLETSAAQPASLSAQAQKLAEQLLAKVNAAVSKTGGTQDGGTQTTPSLDIDRPLLLGPPPLFPSAEKPPAAAGGDGSPLPKDVNAAMAMAAQVAEDIDFPLPEEVPMQEDLQMELEHGPRKLAFGSPVQMEERPAEHDDPLEAYDAPQEEPATQEQVGRTPAISKTPEESRAIVRCATKKNKIPRERNCRLKSIVEKGRKSLAGAGLVIENGVRRSTRDRRRPLEWWRNESLIWERRHDSLPTISRVVLLAPDPTWPRNYGRSARKVKAREAVRKRPALMITSCQEDY